MAMWTDWLRVSVVGLVALWLVLGGAQAHGAELLTFEVVAQDGRLIPDTLRVPAKTRFKIVIRNQGSDAVEFESIELRKEKVLAPGVTSFVVIAPLKPGTYRYFDEFHPDTGQGRIIVE
ncbi:cupredoxin domain-containing protein [Sulfurivermis fontis]|uniref:cupredoxin domain-containing protein n=1 Tax=Sulfurivermis fontis TaxID=1972068 RepID=UPI0018D5495C|nr:cupredoxin domain-containing protein [Sulfurivermis fontis]